LSVNVLSQHGILFVDARSAGDRGGPARAGSNRYRRKRFIDRRYQNVHMMRRVAECPGEANTCNGQIIVLKESVSSCSLLSHASRGLHEFRNRLSAILMFHDFLYVPMFIKGCWSE
jgi:hypothetical protein